MEALGIDLKLIIAQVVNFGIVLFLLQRFLYKPIISMLDERKEKIARGLEDSEKAKETLTKSEETAGKAREKAYAEAKEFSSEAEREAGEKAIVIINKANEQAEKILEKANEEAAGAKEKALLEAKREINNVVILALDKIIGEELNKDQKEKLTAKAIKEL